MNVSIILKILFVLCLLSVTCFGALDVTVEKEYLVNEISLLGLHINYGYELDDFDSDENTKRFIVPVLVGDVATVSALTSSTVTDEDKLPPDWMFKGGDSGSKLIRSIDLSEPGSYISDPSKYLFEASVRNTKLKLELIVVNVNINAYEPSKTTNAHSMIPEIYEEFYPNNRLHNNVDDDNGDGVKDNNDLLIDDDDNDIMKLVIEQIPIPAGLGFLSYPDEKVRLYIQKDGELELLQDEEIDFSSPSGDLAGITNHDLVLYVEAIHVQSELDITFSILNTEGNLVWVDRIGIHASMKYNLQNNVCKSADIFHNLSQSDPECILFNDQKIADFEEGFDNPFWERKGIGIKVKEGVDRADAIEDIFICKPAEEVYSMECLTAIYTIQYRAVLHALEELYVDGRDRFNQMYKEIILHADLNEEREPGEEGVDYTRVITYWFSSKDSASIKGDFRYIISPKVDPEELEWQGENIIQMENDFSYGALVYGHPMGKRTVQEVIDALEKYASPKGFVDTTDDVQRIHFMDILNEAEKYD